ncbi:MAG: exosortase E/protease, VPEID-CTERM system [Isosphaeraceae bacterium]|nr:exosortase E/protease, VPEID-CTERM system [Isosphaeraceae bacterium]
MLIAETLVLSARFDSGSLSGFGWVADLAAAARSLPQIAVVILALGYVAFRQTPDGFHFPADNRSRRATAILLVAHATAFAVFHAMTSQLLEPRSGNPNLVQAWVTPWVASGLAVAATAALVALPISSWIRLLSTWSRPIGFLAVVAASAYGFSRITPTLWIRLAGLTLACVETLLRLMYGTVVSDRSKSIVGTEAFSVEIAPQCSGYEGIGLILVFIGAYLWTARRSLRFPRALLLLPSAVVAIWMTNVLRITALIVLGTEYSEAAALNGFHSQAGWLAFNAVGLGMVFWARSSSFFVHRATVGTIAAEPSAAVEVDTGVSSSSTASYLVPMLSIVLASMVGMSLTAGFDRFYGLRVAAAATALWFHREAFIRWWTGWTFSFAPILVGIGAFVVWMALEPSVGRSPTIDAGLAGLSRPEAWAWLALRVFGSVITVPIAEEAAFRGFLPRRLLRSDFESIPMGRFTLATFVLSSALFGLMHGRVVAGTLAGLCYAYALQRRGQLGDAILAHAVTNALIAILAIGAGLTSLWS